MRRAPASGRVPGPRLQAKVRHVAAEVSAAHKKCTYLQADGFWVELTLTGLETDLYFGPRISIASTVAHYQDQSCCESSLPTADGSAIRP